MRAFLDNLYRAGGVLGAIFLFAIFTIVLLQVGANLIDFIAASVTGHAIGLAIPSYAEIAGFMLAGASFLALPYALQHGTHIRVNLFIQRMGPGGRRITDTWSFLVGFILIAWLSFYAWELVLESYEFGDLSPGLIAVPIWIPQITLGLGTTLMAISLLDGFISSLLNKNFFITGDADELGAE
ncbi:TRAP transporter small permease [Terasakiella sp. A23]|uniref:TRAP transporter small permease n=1 Tax=Terasakiella sp. FCG-A23 TaxID=3080561 RepID=UPI002952D538|nr:TRAP transporter small permease [Terasakiella sp. A23]MDV7339168.1 TRAP transporter small permease [Terasakiella sp. A23]